MNELANVIDLWLASLALTHGVTQVAVAYLRQYPAEANAATLRVLLAAESDTTGPLPAAIRRDFAQGRTIAVNGWMLARTEARLAALRHLERS
jgi:hypothetical protein